jgi:phage I-like protein
MKTSASSLALGASSHVIVAVCADSDGVLPEWIQLLPMGTFGGRDGRGPWKLDDLAHAEQVVAGSLADLGRLQAVVDYDHQTEWAAKEGVGGTAPAAGWLEEMQARADGIWGRPRWTPKGEQALRDGEYRYLSPVFRHERSSGRVTRILRAALINKPNLDLPAVAAGSIDGEHHLDTLKVTQALGLGEDAGDDAVLAAISGLKARDAGMATVAQAAGLAADAKAEDVVTAIQAAGEGGDTIVTLNSQLQALKAERAAEKAQAKVDAAIEGGKIAPAARTEFLAICAADPDRFDRLMAATPTIVVAGQKEAPERKDGELDDDQLAVCSQLGITAEQFKASQKDAA